MKNKVQIILIANLTAAAAFLVIGLLANWSTWILVALGVFIVLEATALYLGRKYVATPSPDRVPGPNEP